MTSPVGSKIRRAPQQQLADEAGQGVSRSWVASVETGRTPKPGPRQLGRVALVLGLELRELLALSDQLGSIDLAEPQPVGDLSRLIDAMTAQTLAITRLLDPQESRSLYRQAVAEAVSGVVQPLLDQSRRLEERTAQLEGMLQAIARQLAGGGGPASTLDEPALSEQRPQKAPGLAVAG